MTYALDIIRFSHVNSSSEKVYRSSFISFRNAKVLFMPNRRHA